MIDTLLETLDAAVWSVIKVNVSLSLFWTDSNLTANGTYDVLLSAYMNSGSRFAGRLLGFRSDSFYFYEPLWKFSTWNYYKPPNVSCSTTFGSCR